MRVTNRLSERTSSVGGTPGRGRTAPQFLRGVSADATFIHRLFLTPAQALGGKNPRWRVSLWRATIAGVWAVVLSSAVLPGWGPRLWISPPEPGFTASVPFPQVIMTRRSAGFFIARRKADRLWRRAPRISFSHHLVISRRLIRKAWPSSKTFPARKTPTSRSSMSSTRCGPEEGTPICDPQGS
jgi:hypothetical protein